MGPPQVPPALPQYVPIPLGHYDNPLENMVAAAARLAALPVDGDSPAAIETRRVRELLQTTLAQQEAYSYSRDRIHSTPRPGQSPSYSRHMVSATGSSNVRRHDPPLATARLITEPFTQQTKTERGKRRSRCLS